MTSSISTTPLSGVGKKLDRPQRERERRCREMAAYKSLRHALDCADPRSFWRMEKVDIAEGAIFMIQKLTGDPIPEREPVAVEDRSADQEEKVNRVIVEKRRRARESTAIKKLKEILMEKDKAFARMEKIEVIEAASKYIKSIVPPAAKEDNGSISPEDGSSEIGSPESSSDTNTDASSPDTISVTSRTGSPIIPTIHSAWTAQPMMIPSLMQPLPFLPIGMYPVLQVPSIVSSGIFSEPAAKKARSELWRPWN